VNTEEKNNMSNHSSIPTQPPISPNTIFRKNSLTNIETRKRIQGQLQNKTWKMIVLKTLPDKGFGFLSHQQFPEDIFFNFNKMSFETPLVKGDMVDVEIFITQHYKTKEWNFNAKIISKTDQRFSIGDKGTAPYKRSRTKGRKKSATRPVQRTTKQESPLDNLGKQQIAVASASAFSINSDFITIYIDEAWPGSHSKEKPQDRGVIGGIVWIGYQPDFETLGWIDTHLRTSPQGIEALGKLMNCHRALPFVMPIDAGGDDNAQKHYFELLVCSIKLLLGWLLPQNGKPCKVRILIESFQNFPVDTDKTQYFKAILEEAKLINPIRFYRWNLEVVRWGDKPEEYIPYADLVAHLSLEHTGRNIETGKKADYRNWPGYVPLSLELLPRLTRLDQVEDSGNVADILDFVANLYGTELCKVVLNDIGSRLSKRADLQRKLIETLEDLYQGKNRDLNSLRKQTKAVKQLVTVPTEDTPVRQRLLWHLIDLQMANHDGDPVKGVSAVEHYKILRPSVVQHDRELVAYADLNVAVHLNDQFRFDEAMQLSEGMATDEDAIALSPLARGRSFSSLGQIYSIAGQYFASEQCFKEALSLLSEAVIYEPKLAGDMDQTRVYRAINAMDGDFENKMDLLRETIGTVDPETIARLAKSSSPRDQYHHHLLLRGLWMVDSMETFTKNYLEHVSLWQTDTQHPWELINCYRGLLLFLSSEEQEDQETSNKANLWFDRAIRITLSEQHGITVKLIGAVIATIASCCMDEDRYPNTAKKLLSKIEKAMPAAAEKIAILRQILKDPQPDAVDEALGVLPFNYR
jgi:hypothetical protein